MVFSIFHMLFGLHREVAFSLTATHAHVQSSKQPTTSRESAVIGAARLRPTINGNALLRSGGGWGRKEPDPDNPPHVGFTPANIRSRLSTHSDSLPYGFAVHSRSRACTPVNFKKENKMGVPSMNQTDATMTKHLGQNLEERNEQKPVGFHNSIRQQKGGINFESRDEINAFSRQGSGDREQKPGGKRHRRAKLAECDPSATATGERAQTSHWREPWPRQGPAPHRRRIR